MSNKSHRRDYICIEKRLVNNFIRTFLSISIGIIMGISGLAYIGNDEITGNLFKIIGGISICTSSVGIIALGIIISIVLWKKKGGNEKMFTKKKVTLDNKSRRGTYLYIKEPKKKGRYYKIKDDEPEEIYEQYYTQRYQKKKRLGTLQQYKKAYKTPLELQKGKVWQSIKVSKALKNQAKKYLKTISKRPTISEALKSGLTSVTIKNIHNTNAKTIQTAQRSLLQDLIIDKNLLEIITKPENTKKLANRYENKIEFKNEKGQITTTAIKYNTTPEQIINELKKEFKKNTEKDYIERTLKNLGYKTEGKTDKFRIGSIDLTITFRKGK